MAEILDTDWPVCAHTVDIGFVSCVVVGPEFWRLPEDQQIAILVHELGHIHGKHGLTRFLLAPVALFFPRLARRIARQQELSADRYAARAGHAGPLLQFLRQVRADPDRSARIAQLQSFIDGGFDA